MRRLLHPIYLLAVRPALSLPVSVAGALSPALSAKPQCARPEWYGDALSSAVVKPSPTVVVSNSQLFNDQRPIRPAELCESFIHIRLE